MNKKKETTLILFTTWFPYGHTTESAFLGNEINYLTGSFDNLIIVPSNITGEPIIDANIPIDSSLAPLMTRKSKINYLFYALIYSNFYMEFFIHNPGFWTVNKFKRLVVYSANIKIISLWAKKVIKPYIKNTNKNFILYTYWNTEITVALARLFKTFSNVKVITRAHGFDLFEERNEFIPFYRLTIFSIDHIYLVSKAGLSYLKNKFPDLSCKMSVSRLGVTKARVICKPSIDNLVRIVSCSSIIPLKRVDLIIRGMESFIEKFNKNVHWVHFGDGMLANEINHLASQLDSGRFKYVLKGFVPNQAILEYYSKNPVDIFITTSSTEGGLPVSLQEAQAYGIPVIGTSAGGIPEVIKPGVGILLSENPSETEIGEAINNIIKDSKAFYEMRNNSVHNWEENFNEKHNFADFCKDLKNN